MKELFSLLKRKKTKQQKCGFLKQANDMFLACSQANCLFPLQALIIFCQNFKQVRVQKLFFSFYTVFFSVGHDFFSFFKSKKPSGMVKLSLLDYSLVLCLKILTIVVRKKQVRLKNTRKMPSVKEKFCVAETFFKKMKGLSLHFHFTEFL